MQSNPLGWLRDHQTRLSEPISEVPFVFNFEDSTNGWLLQCRTFARGGTTAVVVFGRLKQGEGRGAVYRARSARAVELSAGYGEHLLVALVPCLRVSV